MIEEDGGAEILERAVKWVMCVEDPLTTDEILDAVRLFPSNDGTALERDPIIAEETLLDICGHLIVKDPRSKRWKFPHASVFEYIEEVHQWSLQRAHSFVARICLLHLISDDSVQNMKDRKITWFFPRINGIQHYMETSWFTHVVAVEKPGLREVEVSKLLEIFLGINKSPQQSSQHYQYWVQYFSREGLSREGLRLQNRRYQKFLPVENFYPAETPIFGICIFGFYHLLQDYWKSGVDVLLVNRGGMDLLSIAAYYGHLEICEKLIELGLDVNRKRNSHSNDSTALTVAVSRENMDIMRFLISQGADPNLPLNGSSALCASAFLADENSSKCTEILLDAKADPNHPCSSQCEFTYALEHAAYKGNIETARILLRNGADVNLLSEAGDYGSALAAAAYQGNGKLCQLLIEHGADVNADLKVGKYGSALAAAASEGYHKICQLLIDHGADINAPLYREYPNALAAARDGGKIARPVCRLLINLGARDNVYSHHSQYIVQSLPPAIRTVFMNSLEDGPPSREEWSPNRSSDSTIDSLDLYRVRDRF